MGIMDIGIIASAIGNGVYGYAMTSGMPLDSAKHAVGIMNYLAVPVGLFGNGVCNMPGEFGRGPVDYANSPRRNGLALHKNKDGSVDWKVIDNNPKRRISNLEVGLAQSFPFLMLNNLLGIILSRSISEIVPRPLHFGQAP